RLSDRSAPCAPSAHTACASRGRFGTPVAQSDRRRSDAYGVSLGTFGAARWEYADFSCLQSARSETSLRGRAIASARAIARARGDSSTMRILMLTALIA